VWVGGDKVTRAALPDKTAALYRCLKHWIKRANKFGKQSCGSIRVGIGKKGAQTRDERWRNPEMPGKMSKRNQ